MAMLEWDITGERFYETGVDRGVLYVEAAAGNQEGDAYQEGVAWNGLVSVNERPSGAEPTAHYADNIKYITLFSAEEFDATIEAFTFPDEFMLCDGTVEVSPGVTIGQQNRSRFGLAYRTLVGNDVSANDHGYKIHLLYGAQASPSEKAYNTVNDSPEPITFSWEVTTTPVATTSSYKPTSVITIDSRRVPEVKLSALEEVLYGSETEEPRLPSPELVFTMLSDS